MNSGADMNSGVPVDFSTIERRYDGIVCFGGEDWWYHNRGHYDLQMMRELSAEVPVLYVNSIGMRVPRPAEGRMFLRRVTRKLRSLRRGLVKVSDSMAVFSPPFVPGLLGSTLTRRLLRRTVLGAMERVGIHRPLAWVACPPALDTARALDPVALVYQRTDRYEHYTGVDSDRIVRFDRRAKAIADLTLFCSHLLMNEESRDCRRPLFVDHGVDFDRFSAPHELPRDLADLPGPRIGFVGGIDGHTFDPALLLSVAGALPHCSFVLVGASSLPAPALAAPNVHRLGQRPYESVAAYMNGCDVLIMPWRQSPWIEACNPVKLKEYLATGRPVVSTPFAELSAYRPHVRIAEDAPAFARAIEASLADAGDAVARRRRVQFETWPIKAREVSAHLLELGFTTASDSRDTITPVLPVQPPSLRLSTGDDPPAIEVAMSAGRKLPRRHQLKRSPPLRLVRSESGHAAQILVLAGGLAPSPLVSAAGASVLDLPVTTRSTLLRHLIQAFQSCDEPALKSAPIRILCGGVVPPPAVPDDLSAHVTIEFDRLDCRGPAGLLHDAAASGDPNHHIVVVDASRFVAGALPPLLSRHEDLNADVSVVTNADRSPSGIWVIRLGALQSVAAHGFVDLKEQWLERLHAAGARVLPLALSGPGCLPVRTLDDLLSCARIAAVQPHLRPFSPRPVTGLITDPASRFRVICPGALVGPGAVVIDSIVMSGAVIGPDAVIARSLVCPGTLVQEGRELADCVVQGERVLTTARGRERRTV